MKYDDLNGLNFIGESDLWKSGYFDKLIEENDFINKRPYSFNQIYTFEGANKVYQYQKKLFFMCGYDPFSFTTENLSEEDKIKNINYILSEINNYIFFLERETKINHKAVKKATARRLQEG